MRARTVFPARTVHAARTVHPARTVHTARTVFPARVGISALLATALLLMPSALADDIEPYDLAIEPYDLNIEPLATEATSGSTTTVTLNTDILFDTGSSELSAAAKARIGQLVAEVPQGAAISVDGHTDDVPYRRGNDVLSKERAQAVADAITAARPDLEPKVAGHGDAQPVASNSDPAGREKNRRVEIRYQG